MDGDAELQRRFAYALRAAMAVKSWTPRDLADRIGRDQSTVNRWVNGDAVPNLLILKSLAEALDVRPELLYDPPPVPEYPISEYLVRQAAAAAVEEGIRRPRRRRAS